jgi:hypothetical protein
MILIIGLIALTLVWLWLGYEMLYSPMVDNDDKINDIDPDNEHDNLF